MDWTKLESFDLPAILLFAAYVDRFRRATSNNGLTTPHRPRDFNCGNHCLFPALRLLGQVEIAPDGDAKINRLEEYFSKRFVTYFRTSKGFEKGRPIKELMEALTLSSDNPLIPTLIEVLMNAPHADELVKLSPSDRVHEDRRWWLAALKCRSSNSIYAAVCDLGLGMTTSIRNKGLLRPDNLNVRVNATDCDILESIGRLQGVPNMPNGRGKGLRDNILKPGLEGVLDVFISTGKAWLSVGHQSFSVGATASERRGTTIAVRYPASTGDMTVPS